MIFLGRFKYNRFSLNSPSADSDGLFLFVFDCYLRLIDDIRQINKYLRSKCLKYSTQTVPGPRHCYCVDTDTTVVGCELQEPPSFSRLKKKKKRRLPLTWFTSTHTCEFVQDENVQLISFPSSMSKTMSINRP